MPNYRAKPTQSYYGDSLDVPTGSIQVGLHIDGTHEKSKQGVTLVTTAATHVITVDLTHADVPAWAKNGIHTYIHIKANEDIHISTTNNALHTTANACRTLIAGDTYVLVLPQGGKVYMNGVSADATLEYDIFVVQTEDIE